MSVPLRRAFSGFAASLALHASGAFAFAQDSATAPAPAAPPSGVVEENELKFGSVTLYTENDKYFAGTDEHYTNGFKLSALSTDLRNFNDDSVPGPVRALSRLLGSFAPPDRPYKFGLSIGQNIYTPRDIQNPAYQPDDRPYAAWLYLGVAYHLYHPPAEPDGMARLDVFEINAGVVGPSAIGRQIQNGVHEIIDVDTAKGWRNQINDEPGLNLVYERRYRFATDGARSGWGADFIPHAGGSLGNIFTYANAGFEVRAGYALPADFGSNLIRPSGDSNSLRRAPFSAFLFAAADGRAVARDITLDGNTFRDSPSIDKEPFVADLFAGIGLGTRSWSLTYAQAWRSHEFKGQDRASVFGSLSLSFFY